MTADPAPSIPSPPAAEIAAVSLPPLTLAIGAPTTGTSTPNLSSSHIPPTHHTPPPARHIPHHTQAVQTGRGYAKGRSVGTGLSGVGLGDGWWG
ncbi:hypothetical protein GCM10029976_040190 [Kribbella albertanoniae]